MDVKEIAAKYMKFHSNPLIKIELPTSKYFLDDTKIKNEEIKKYQNILEDALHYVRVERRSARSKGVWLNDLKLCKLAKVVGPILKHHGYQDKSGMYLFPEETLYLMEQNRLEVIYEGHSVSLCEAYKLVMPLCNLQKYRAYKKLVSQGFKLVNKERMEKIRSNGNKNISMSSKTNKRKVEDMCDIACSGSSKTKKIDYPHANVNTGQDPTYESDYFNKIFEKLRENSPVDIYTDLSTEEPDYYGFLPSPITKHRHEFNLYIRENINYANFNQLEDVLNILAICSNDNITFYRFPKVNIPNLT